MSKAEKKRQAQLQDLHSLKMNLIEIQCSFFKHNLPGSGEISDLIAAVRDRQKTVIKEGEAQ